MIKNEPKAPMMLLLVLFMLIVGIILVTKINTSKGEKTFQKVHQKHQLETELMK